MDVREITEKYHLNVYKRFNLILKGGKGVKLFDDKGKEYIDFLSGIGVNALGYNHEVVVSALKEGIGRLLHVSNLFYTEELALLSKRLIEASGFSKVFFTNSGTEANELAIKMVRRYGSSKGRFEIIALKNSFHGRSMGSLSITGREKYHRGFKPLLNGVKFVPLNDKDAFVEAFTPETAGVFLETIQGEGGMRVIDREYISFVREFTQDKDVLLVVDEVQTGMGRTGKFLSFMNFDVKPDITTMAKALGGGLPMGAVLTTEKVAEVMDYGSHGCTFGGNPFIARVSLSVLNFILKDGFLDEVIVKGEYLKKRLSEEIGSLPFVKGIGGMGLMVGIYIDGFKPRDIAEKILDRGVIVGTSGEDTIRLLPPLIINKGEIDEGVKIISSVLKELS